MKRLCMTLFSIAIMSACESESPTVPHVSIVDGGPISGSESPACEVFAYVTGEFPGISIVRTSDHTVVDVIPLPGILFEVAITPDGGFAYVTRTGFDDVAVIRVSDRTVVTTIPLGPLGTMGPLIIDTTPDGQFAYVSNIDANAVSVIRISDNTVIGTVPVGGSPFGLAIKPDGTEVWVRDAIAGSGHVSIISTASNTVVDGLNVASSSTGLAFTPDGQFAYIPQAFTLGQVAVVRTSDRTVVATIGVGSRPLDVAITHDGRFAYVTNAGDPDAVSVIRTSDNRVIATVPFAAESNPGAVGITPDDAFTYVLNFAAGTISVLRVADNTVVHTISGFHRHAGIAFTPCLPCTRLDLRDKVEALGPLGSGILNKGQTNALLRKLDQVDKLIAKGKEDEAAMVLEGFRQQVKDLTAEGVVPPEEATDLIDCAEGLLTTPTEVKIDGIKSPGEWDAASSVAVFTGATFRYMNDDENLYLALEVEDEALTPDDRFEIRFDDTLDGVDTVGDDELNALLADLSDQHFGPNWGITDAQQDGEAAAGSNGGVNFFEVAHPLNSGDPNDFALLAGSSVGYCLRYFDDGTATSSTSYPTDCVLSANAQALYDVLAIAGP